MSKDRIQKFKPQTPEGATGAKAFLRDLAKEGGWDSFEEFVNSYVFPMAANRLLALDRYNKAHGKATAGKKKGGAKKKTAKRAKAKATPRKAKAAPRRETNGVSEAAVPNAEAAD